jgi:hypothetical protein
MNKGTSLQIVGLSELELLELEELLPDSAMERLQDESLPKTAHGDLGLTAAVVIVTAAMVHGLSVWLAKRRIEDIKESTLSFEKLADGTIRLNVTQMSRGAVSESPDAKVVESLKAQMLDILQAGAKATG